MEETWQQAVKSYEHAAELNTNDPDAAYNLAFVKKQIGLIAQLREAMRRAKQAADEAVRRNEYHRALEIMESLNNPIAAKKFQDYIKKLKDIDAIVTPASALAVAAGMCQAARAQSADDFFNSGAHFYISNNIPQALEPVESGLKQYPDDVKLKKLYELLKTAATIAKQPVATKPAKAIATAKIKQPAKSAATEPAEFATAKAERTKPVGPRKTGQNNNTASGEKQIGQKQENQNEQGQPVAAGQMTPEEAKRLLDAQKGDEQFLQLKPQGKPENPNQPIKDW